MLTSVDSAPNWTALILRGKQTRYHLELTLPMIVLVNQLLFLAAECVNYKFHRLVAYIYI